MIVLVISAHPDDETLGCGGALLRHRDRGDELHWVVVTSAHCPAWSEEEIQVKEAEKRSITAAYGIRRSQSLGFPSARLDTVPFEELIKSLGAVIESVKPELVYVVHDGDVHSDHRLVHLATLSVLKPSRMRQIGVSRILAYETLSSTEAGLPEKDAVFIPNIFLDISRYIDRKIEIMELYASEMQSDPMPRGPSAIRSLARYRGGTIGVQYAEAFMLVREVI